MAVSVTRREFLLGILGLGVLQHNSVGSILSQTEYEGTTSHLIGGVSGVNVVRSHTIIIAPADADESVRASADYVCDGTADENEIETALALGNYNRSIKCLPGTYTFSSPLTIPVLQNFFFDARGCTFLGGVHMDSAMDSTFLFDVIGRSSGVILEIEPSADSEILGADEVYYLINVNIHVNALSMTGTPPVSGTYGLKVTLANTKRCAHNNIDINIIEKAETAVYITNPVGADSRHFHKNSIRIKGITQCDDGIIDGQTDNVSTKFNHWEVGYLESRTGAGGDAITIFGQDQLFMVDGTEGFTNGFVLGNTATNNTIYVSSTYNTISDSSNGSNKFIGACFMGEGTGTINNGATTAVITHGRGFTPTAGDISITWTENPTNDPGNWWISSITSTQFTVNVRNDPGASNLDFTWAIRRV